MNDEHPPLLKDSEPFDRIQHRADILESNLFNSLSKDKDLVCLQFSINRKTAPDPVILKGLIQVLPRLGIRFPQALLLIREVLPKTLEQGEELKIKKQLHDPSELGDLELEHLGVFMEIRITSKALAVKISGVAPIISRDGAIEKAFFDHKRCPGLVGEDGAIDFREINNYPMVKAEDNLFFITPEVQGRSGMQYNGTLIPVTRANALSFKLEQGVDMIDSLDSKGKSRGYFLRATQTGVVVLTRDRERITGIGIQDTLDIKRLDYSTGNIGTNFTCPVSMKIDTIRSGFSIRAKGMVEAEDLEGGEIETYSHAKVHTAHPKSKITAKKDILVQFSRHARLSSLNGRIIISDELVDTHADGKSIIFEKSKGVVSGNTLDAGHISLKKVSFSGENTLYFGCRLFEEKESMIQARAGLEKDKTERKTKEEKLTQDLHHKIKGLSKTLAPIPKIRENLKTFILAARNMDYKILLRELETIGQTIDTKEMHPIKKDLDGLEQIRQDTRATERRNELLLKEIARADQAILSMTLDIEGYLRRASSLKIFLPDTPLASPDKPAFFLESQKDQDTRIQIQGRYSPSRGLQITQV